ncbi:MAG: GspH/FimT family pseudopilin [Betaproteobacteria bacterium]|nr:GspH/FimT family pseudopilin [Betaproteobacteria bacterium]
MRSSSASHAVGVAIADIGVGTAARVPSAGAREPSRRHRASGATLIELLVALTIVGVLLSSSLPDWGAFLAERGQRDRADALMQTLLQARSEAIKRGSRVDVCPAAGGGCAKAPAGWEAGWIIVAGRAGDGAQGVPQAVIAREAAAPAGVTIRGNRPVADYVSYTSLGQARRIDGGLQMGTFTVCRPGLSARKVVLASSGRVRIGESTEACP